MPKCRIELFTSEEGYDPICIIGEMGHIAASSDGGPRANKGMSSRERDDYDNLILLCRNCHRPADTLKQSYSEQRLRDLKADHEAWVRTSLPERGFSQQKWNVLRLQGEFPFDPQTIAEALSPDQEEMEESITISPSRYSWLQTQAKLSSAVQKLIAGSDSVGSRFAVFPLTTSLPVFSPAISSRIASMSEATNTIGIVRVGRGQRGSTVSQLDQRSRQIPLPMHTRPRLCSCSN